MIGGGLLYTVGALSYHHRRPDPYPRCSGITGLPRVRLRGRHVPVSGHRPVFRGRHGQQLGLSSRAPGPRAPWPCFSSMIAPNTSPVIRRAAAARPAEARRPRPGPPPRPPRPAPRPPPPRASPAATTAPSSITTLAARPAALVRPATRGPNPDGRAEGEPVAATTATRLVTAASTSPDAPVQPVRSSRAARASALTWTSRTSTRVATPSGPASDRRMISRAWSARRRLPSPSAVSASPSGAGPRSPPRAAPPRGPRQGTAVPRTIHPPQRKPSRPTRPIPGWRRGPAAEHGPGRRSLIRSPPTPAGITVNRLSATRQPGP
jgi:hypothetical protein